MSEQHDHRTGSTEADGTDGTDGAVAARLAVVEAENEQLRAAYAQARRSQHRRTALGLAGIGLVSVLGAAFLPPVRQVLLALGGTGLFAAVLTYYLTPERFVAANVGEAVYESLAANGTAAVAELGLADVRIYAPAGESGNSVRLYVPQDSTGELPAPGDLDEVFVTTDDGRGLSLRPTGEPLFEEFERALTDELSTAPERLAAQLAEGLTEQFEIARSATTDADANRLTIGVTGSVFGSVARFDQPVASFVAAGVVRALGTPVRTVVRPGDGDRADYLVTCRWDDVADVDP